MEGGGVVQLFQIFPPAPPALRTTTGDETRFPALGFFVHVAPPARVPIHRAITRQDRLRFEAPNLGTQLT